MKHAQEAVETHRSKTRTFDESVGSDAFTHGILELAGLIFATILFSIS